MERELPGLTVEQTQLLTRFYELVIRGNQEQNLTRITAPEDFVELHLKDAALLVQTVSWGGRALDLGSGAGIPGIPAAILGINPWVLAESEGRKAQFLVDVVQELGLRSKVQVYSGRGEVWLKQNQVGLIATRAVGSVSKILEWIGKCSTWNKLALFKGPGWEKEWEELGQKKHLFKQVQITCEQSYSVGYGAEAKQRKLVVLEKVPRRTP